MVMTFLHLLPRLNRHRPAIAPLGLIALIVGLGSAMIPSMTFGASAKDDPSKRPSFVVFITDDQRADCLGLEGHPLLRTPNIDRLADEGVAFRNAFVTTAICCVSRASFYTGQYARNHRIADFATPLSDDQLARTFPGLLQQAGYRTGCFGKWGLNGNEPRAIFNAWDATGSQGRFFQDFEGERIHNSEWLARQSVRFIEQTPADQPFCLLVLYKSPHDPFTPDPIDGSLFIDDPVIVPPTYSTSDLQSQSEAIQVSEGRTRLERRHPTTEAYQEFVKQYLRCLAGVDRSVGKVIDALRKADRLDETVVVFTSDHGFLLGEHGLSGKWLMYEESIRIPMVMRDPGLPESLRGTRPEGLVLNIDLAPTILTRAGLTPPESTDGRDLAPLITGEADNWRDDFFYEHHFGYRGRIPQSDGVRTERWKYVTYLDEPSHGYEQLFDLLKDPLERRNLIGTPEHAGILDALKRRYATYRDRLGPPVLPSR